MKEKSSSGKKTMQENDNESENEKENKTEFCSAFDEEHIRV